MLKKVIFIVSTFLALVYCFFFTDFFTLNFSTDQLESISFIFKSYLLISASCFILGEIIFNLLFEPKTAQHTGDLETEMTVKKLEWI